MERLLWGWWGLVISDWKCDSLKTTTKNMGQNIDNTFNLKCSTKVMENEKAGSHFWQKDRHSIEIKGQSNSWRVKRQTSISDKKVEKVFEWKVTNFKEGWDLTKFTDKKQSFYPYAYDHLIINVDPFHLSTFTFVDLFLNDLCEPKFWR